MPPRPGYTPVDYVNASDFWGLLFAAHWVPSQLFARLCDSLFFHLDENYADEKGQFKGSGRLEFFKILLIQVVHAGQEEVEKLPYKFWSELYRAVWDHDGVHYTLYADSDDFEYPVLDRQNFLTSCVRDVQYDPDGEHILWNKLITLFNLCDPMTGKPFPLIPRSALPRERYVVAQQSRDRSVARYLQSLILTHSPDHTKFHKMVTTSSTIKCDQCGQMITGTRYKCATCFDYDECDTCFHTIPLQAPTPIGWRPVPVTNASPPMSQPMHAYWHTFTRASAIPGEFVCDICASRNDQIRNHCNQCPDYDECDRCRLQMSTQAGPSPPPYSPTAQKPHSASAGASFQSFGSLPPQGSYTAMTGSPPRMPTYGAPQPVREEPDRLAQLSNIAKAVSAVMGLVDFGQNMGFDQ